MATSPGLTAATSQPFKVSQHPWQLVTTGPWGGAVNALAFAPAAGNSPSALYAATNGGVFVSSDLGASWTKADLGLPGISSIAVAPSAPDIAYVGAGQWAFRTPNRGNGWKSANSGTSGQPAYASFVWSIAVDPTNPNIVLAGSNANVLRSVDGGRHWSPTSLGYGAYDVAFDPNNPSIAYAAAIEGSTSTPKGVYKSIDGGNNWSSINSGLPTLEIQDIFVTATCVFATTTRTTFRNIDGGSVWTDLQQNSPATLITYSRVNTSTVFEVNSGSLLVSTDGGATFPTSRTLQFDIHSIVCGPTDANELFGGGGTGVYHSIDGGVNWTPTSTGIPQLGISAILVGQTASSVLIGTSDGKTYQTTDGGKNWNASTMDPADKGIPLALARDNGGSIYLSTGQLHVSLTSGVNWGPAAISPTGHALHYGGFGLLTGTSSGLYRLTSPGGNWSATQVLNKATTAVASSSTLGFAATSPTGLYVSTNGNDWTSTTIADQVTAILLDDAYPKTLFIGTCSGDTKGGIRSSIDGGANWSDIMMPGICVDAMTEINRYYEILAAGRTNRGTFLRSKDMGSTWQSTTIDTNARVQAGAIGASQDGSVIYVGTSAGLYKSITGGL
jgi:photosystem II stability/assembly factor-like uncharacterized protein